MEVTKRIPRRRGVLDLPSGRDFLVTWLPAIHAIIDSSAWVMALAAMAVLAEVAVPVGGLVTLGVVAVSAQSAGGWAIGLYRRWWRYGSFDEVLALSASVVVSAVSVAIVDGHGPRALGVDAIVAAGVMTLSFSVAARSVWRLARQRRERPISAEPVVIVGAGAAGERVARTLVADVESAYLPVAFVDDDPQKAAFRCVGARVQGSVDDLAAVAERFGAVTILLAVPSAGADFVRRVDQICRRHALELHVVPPLSTLIGSLSRLVTRPVTEVDLLGRQTAELDDVAVADLIAGRRVLVTGAGGSIGSELCRQLAALRPERLFMLDRDESGLHAVQLSIAGRALLDDPSLVLADLRDRERMFEVMDEARPHVVFHAAALKHLPLLQTAPREAWKTNVLGTQNVIDAAAAAGVGHFINISTDKAAAPSSVLGYTKRMTERLTAQANLDHRGTWVSVRFGNVLGSRGSVLTAFRAQAARGEAITVTDPDVTRYFMTVEEAVRLTLVAATVGSAGEVLVLDMGEPVRIADVARRFAEQHTPPLGIVITGLRPGEKLHEDLIGPGEAPERRSHPMIDHVGVPPMALDELRDLLDPERTGAPDLTEESLRRAVQWRAEVLR